MGWKGVRQSVWLMVGGFWRIRCGWGNWNANCMVMRDGSDEAEQPNGAAGGGAPKERQGYMARIAIVDDEPAITRIIAHALAGEGHEAHCAYTLRQGMETAARQGCEVVVLDVMLPDGNGLESISSFMELPGSPEVIIITGFAESDSAQIALECGVFDYLQKPFSQSDVRLACGRALEFRKTRMRKPGLSFVRREEIIGGSAALRNCLEAMANAAASNQNVLITGETGTGKELFARALHVNSPRKDRNFVVVDCAAIKSTLMDSTLFGHEKGAFTGADTRRDGLVRQADKGTLFLDEIGELTLEEQKKFLRLLEIRQFYPLGSKRKITSDFRLVCATNRDLEQMVADGGFRADLLYRIRGRHIHLPPLRERPVDIQELAEHYMDTICRRMQIAPKQIYPEFMEALAGYDWPGNVRELAHALDSCISGYPDDAFLQPRHLPTRIRLAVKDLEENGNGSARVPAMGPEAPEPAADMLPDWKTFRRLALDGVEKDYYSQLYEHAGGCVKTMSEASGVTRARVYDLVKKHAIGRK